MAEWKKNDRIEVVIEDMSETGEGIGKTDGFTWFIKDTVIGDKNQEVLWVCKAGADHRTVCKPSGTQMSGCRALRRLSASGNGL